MVWVTWRQHRVALIGLGAALAASRHTRGSSACELHHAYAAELACHPAGSDACLQLTSGFNSAGGFLTNGWILQLVPALIGAFVGAPVLAREMETGTYRYAWTQGFGRWRWTLAKLAGLAVAVTVAAGAISVLFSWYYQPYFGADNQARNLSELTSLAPSLFDLRGVAFGAWTLAAFAIGALAGMLIRRVVPAIVATLVAYAGLAIATGAWLRAHYVAPLVTRSLNVPSSVWVVSQYWHQGRQDGKPVHAVPGPAGRTFPSRREGRWRAEPSLPRRMAVPRPAWLHRSDELPACQPILGVPVDGGWLAGWVVGAAHGHHPVAGPSPGDLKRLVNRLRVDPFVLPDPLLGVEKQSQHTGSRPVEGTGG